MIGLDRWTGAALRETIIDGVIVPPVRFGFRIATFVPRHVWGAVRDTRVGHMVRVIDGKIKKHFPDPNTPTLTT